ncbi:MAG TPA: hypothetical protein VGT78_00350 [Rhizomicrobium sp.]|nr:hypothetical protein [Rhizomicrobium sp.]
MSDSVFVLSHVHGFDECGHEDLKIIGVYGTRWDAESVLAWIKTQPGFRSHLSGFSIDEWTLNETSWREGFVTAHPDGTFSE